MDLYLKDVIKKILKLILILIVLILLSPFIVILLPIKMILFVINFFRNKQYYFKLCVFYINNMTNNKKIFFTHFKKNLISTQREGYYPRYNLTSKHLSYLLEIMNKNKNNEKYSKKILFQMVYFSKFFGTIFNYLSFDSRFEIKESFFSKRKLKSRNIDLLDFYWLLTKNYYNVEIDYKKILISILEYSKVKIKKFTYLYDLLDTIIDSKLDELLKLDLIIYVFEKFKDEKEFSSYLNRLESIEDFDINTLLDKIFSKIKIEKDNEIIVDKILIIINYLKSKKEDKIKTIRSVIYSEIKFKTLLELKVLFSLLTILNNDIENELNNLELNLSDLNELKNFVLFFKLRNNFHKNNIKEKRIKI